MPHILHADIIDGDSIDDTFDFEFSSFSHSFKLVMSFQDIDLAEPTMPYTLITLFGYFSFMLSGFEISLRHSVSHAFLSLLKCNYYFSTVISVIIERDGWWSTKFHLLMSSTSYRSFHKVFIQPDADTHNTLRMQINFSYWISFYLFDKANIDFIIYLQSICQKLRPMLFMTLSFLDDIMIEMSPWLIFSYLFAASQNLMHSNILHIYNSIYDMNDASILHW